MVLTGADRAKVELQYDNCDVAVLQAKRLDQGGSRCLAKI